MSKVNLNTMVAVVLTEYGAKVCNDYHAKYCYPASYGVKPVVKGQQVRMPLWDLMQTFGKNIYMGMPEVPFEGNEIEFLR